MKASFRTFRLYSGEQEAHLRLQGALQHPHGSIHGSANRSSHVHNDIPVARRNIDHRRRSSEETTIVLIRSVRSIVLEVEVVHNADVGGISGQNRLNHVARSGRDFVMKKVHRLSGLSSIVASMTVPVPGEEGSPRARIRWIPLVTSFEERRQSKSRIVPAIRLPTIIATGLSQPDR